MTAGLDQPWKVAGKRRREVADELPDDVVSEIAGELSLLEEALRQREAAKLRLGQAREETIRIEQEIEAEVSQALAAAERLAAARAESAERPVVVLRAAQAPEPPASPPAPPTSSRVPRRTARLLVDAGLVAAVGAAVLGAVSYEQARTDLAAARLCLDAPALNRVEVRETLAAIGRGEQPTLPVAPSLLALGSLEVPSSLTGTVAAAARDRDGAGSAIVAMVQAAASSSGERSAGRRWDALPTPAEIVRLRQRLFATDDAFTAACETIRPGA